MNAKPAATATVETRLKSPTLGARPLAAFRLVVFVLGVGLYEGMVVVVVDEGEVVVVPFQQ